MDRGINWVGGSMKVKEEGRKERRKEIRREKKEETKEGSEEKKDRGVKEVWKREGKGRRA